MRHIYQNATLNIAAVDPCEETGGIYTVRQSYKAQSPFRPRGLLHTRGWVLQEELLSVRTLSFTKFGIFWSCLGCYASEQQCERKTTRPTGDLEELVEDAHALLHYKRAVFTKGAELESRMWANVVEDYSSRSLTLESDKQVAIQGLSSAISERTKDVFHWGMRERSLSTELAWYAVKPNELGVGEAAGSVPSWSWFSARGPVRFTGEPCAEAKFSSISPPRVQVEGLLFAAYIYENKVWLHRDGNNYLLRRKEIPHPVRAFFSSVTANSVPEVHRFADLRGFIPDFLPLPTGPACILHIGDSRSLCVVPVDEAGTEYRRVGLCIWKDYDKDGSLPDHFGFPREEAEGHRLVNLV